MSERVESPQENPSPRPFWKAVRRNVGILALLVFSAIAGSVTVELVGPYLEALLVAPIDRPSLADDSEQSPGLANSQAAKVP